MKLRTLLLAASALSLPGVALAQNSPSFSGTVTLGYSLGSVDGIPGANIDLNTTTLDLETDIGFGSNFNIGLDFGLSMTDVDISGVPIGLEADLMSFGIEPSYQFGNGIYAGLYYRMGDLDVSISFLPITFGVDTNQYGLFGGYEKDALWIEGFYGKSDTSPGLSGVDITDWGLSASYDISPNFEIFGNFTRTGIDLGPADIDLSVYALGAEYSFQNGMNVYGSIGFMDVDLPIPVSIDGNQYTIGMSYDLANANANVPIVVSLEYTMSDLNIPVPISPGINAFSFGLTIPLGADADRTPLNSSTQMARGKYRSAVSGMLASVR
jgi:hypothetical protein